MQSRANRGGLFIGDVTQLEGLARFQADSSGMMQPILTPEAAENRSNNHSRQRSANASLIVMESSCITLLVHF